MIEYVGEHTLPGQLGRLFVSLAFSMAIISAIAYFLYHRYQNPSYKKLARISFFTHTFSVFGIVLTLFYIMLGHYFEYDYVWKHSSLDLPLRYIFSAFWEGQEGSFILWLFWHVVLGCVLMLTAKKWEAPAMIVFALVQAFLASMILGIYPFDLKIGSSPFVLMRNVAENSGLPWTEFPDYLQMFPAFQDGSGLNPLLQNYWMTIHPPTLFLGFASTLVPFAFAMAALFTKDFKGWVKPALPWAYFSIGILGLGILMGGAWAYEALSFGGFWAWDPVENSSLVPWIVMAGAGHLLLIYRNKRTGLGAAFLMTLLSFLLILYSTFLTRSGVLGDSSVHSFVDLGLSGQLLIYLLFFVIIAFGMLIYRYLQLPKGKTEESLSSREFWMFIGSLVLLISAFQIIFSTSIPVINALVGPEGWIPMMEDAMAPPLDAIEHYNSFQVPFAIVIALLMAIGQFLKYGKTNSKTFWRTIMRSLIVSILLTAVVAQLYDLWTDAIYMALLFTSVFAAISNLDFWVFIGKGKLNFSGSSVAHIGFALILFGSLISNGRKQVISQSQVFLSEDLPSNENALMDLNDTIQLGDFKAIFTGMTEKGDKQFYNVSYYAASPEEAKERLFELQPFLQVTDDMGTTPNPDTRHYLTHDIYTHVTYSSYLEPRTPDGYGKEVEVELGTGDSAVYRNHFVIMDSLKVNLGLNEENGDVENLTLTMVARVVNVLGQEFVIKPTYELVGDVLSHTDAYLEDARFKFRFAEVNPDNRKVKLKAWTKLDEKEKPFIVMKAIVFPLINILWVGCILMVIGTFLAVYQRIKGKS
jgi:cytochrome c-type biogenesis protein CcmF